jgi:hypothetical protein
MLTEKCLATLLKNVGEKKMLATLSKNVDEKMQTTLPKDVGNTSEKC